MHQNTYVVLSSYIKQQKTLNLIIMNSTLVYNDYTLWLHCVIEQKKFVNIFLVCFPAYTIAWYEIAYMRSQSPVS